MQRSAGVNTIQTLDNGDMFLDLRGTMDGGGGAPPSPSITDHGQLSGLEDDDHTRYLLRTQVTNVTTQCSGNQIPLGNGSCKPITEIQSISGSEILTINGNGTATTSILSREIFRFKVTPSDLTKNYKFQVNETTSKDLIHKSRSFKNNVFDIRKRAITVSDSLTVEIFDAADLTYTIEVYFK